MAKATSKVTATTLQTAFIVQPGPYAGRVMLLSGDVASAALADGWGVDTEASLAPNETPPSPIGDPAQSYLDWIASLNEAPVPPEPVPAPTISALDPNTAESGAVDDITMVVTGTGFTASSVITFAGLDEPTTLISATEVSTGVKPSLFVVPDTCAVAVRDAGGTSNSLDFTFTAPVEEE